MEISIYVSKNFVNELTPVYKPSNFENRHLHVKRHSSDEEFIEQKNQQFLRVDNSTQTTLAQLYKEGWVIQTLKAFGTYSFSKNYNKY